MQRGRDEDHGYVMVGRPGAPNRSIFTLSIGGEFKNNRKLVFLDFPSGFCRLSRVPIATITNSGRLFCGGQIDILDSTLGRSESVGTFQTGCGIKWFDP